MGGSSTPQPPPKTPEEIAMEKRTALGLKQERAKTERRLKAQARSQLGSKSLLRGIKPKSKAQESVVHSTAMSSDQRDYLKAIQGRTGKMPNVLLVERPELKNMTESNVKENIKKSIINRGFF